MKRLTLLLITIALLPIFKTDAQIPNSGFESLNPNGTLSNWGNVYLMPISIDSLGNTITDSVVFDGYYYGPTNDSHAGNLALELRNAWNFTTSSGIAGAVGSDDDSVFSAWGLQNLVPTYATAFNPFEPFNFGFYYKFFPVNGDSAQATIAMWDSSGNQVGEGQLIITEPSSNYTLIYAPVNYFFNGPADFYSLNISAFYTTDVGYRQPGFGTQLLVDDIGFNYVSLSDNISESENISIFPNPVDDELTIIFRDHSKFDSEIINAFGELIKSNKNVDRVDVSELACGIYFLRITDGDNVFMRKFVKE